MSTNMIYTGKFGHAESCTPGLLEFDSADDAAAKTEIMRMVSDGYRNGSWASITLSDESSYTARNVHGEVESHTAAKWW